MSPTITFRSLILLSWQLSAVVPAHASQEAVLGAERQGQREVIEERRSAPQESADTSPQSRMPPPATAVTPSPKPEAPSLPFTMSIPPERIYSAGRRAEPRLWNMLHQHRYKELEAEVAQLREEDPAWKPPEELLYWLRYHLRHPADEKTAGSGPEVAEKPPSGPAQRYGAAAAAAARLYRRGDTDKALARLTPWETRIGDRRDAERLGLLGWIRLDAGLQEQALADFRQSSAWRPSASAAKGELVALERLGRDKELMTRAPTLVSRWPELDTAATQALRAVAAQRHEQGDFKGAAALLASAAKLGDTDRATRSLTAWNDFKLERWSEAAAAFATLYQEAPSENSARGLALSLRRQGAYGELADLAEADHGPLRQMWKRTRASDDYAAKRFLNAWQRDREEFPQLHGIDSSSLLGALTLRRRTGDPGMGRLEAWGLPILGYEYRNGSTSIQALIERTQLDAGKPASGRPIGSPGFNPPAVYPFAPTTKLSNGLGGELRIRHEDILTLEAMLGRTPTNGELSPQFYGALGASYVANEGAVSVSIERLPVEESILSYTGLRDPYRGDAWGRVQRQGVTLGGWRLVAPRWNLTGQLLAHQYVGEDVLDNNAIEGRVGLGYELGLAGFDYLNLGPFIGYRHFDDNLSHFTRGHGGYYSPQSDIGTGLALNFQTEEGQDWLVEGSGYLGWRRQVEDASPWFPLAPDGRRFASQERQGLGTGLDVEGAWQLSPHWQVGGSAFIDHSPSFDQGGIALTVRYLFEPRRVVFSSDLGPVHPRY